MSRDIMDPAIIPPTDDQGHSAKITVRIQPDWVREIDRTIKHSGLQYCNRGDFIRDAIQRHFEWISSWMRDHDDEVIGSIWGQIKLALSLFDQDRYQQGFGGVMTSLRERVNTFLRRDAKTEAIRHLLKTIGILKNMPDGYWRNVHLTAILGEYKELLESANKVNIIQSLEQAAAELEEEEEA